MLFQHSGHGSDGALISTTSTQDNWFKFSSLLVKFNVEMSCLHVVFSMFLFFSEVATAGML